MLPIELVVHVLDLLHPKEDQESLRACAIVHSTWTPVAQAILFHSLTIHGISPHHEDYTELSDRWIQSLSTLIESLEVHPYLVEYVQDVRLRHLESQNFRDESIQHIFQLPSLVSLEIQWTTFPSLAQFLTMFSTARGLTRIKLSSLRFTEPRGIDEALAAITTPPRSIHIQELHFHLVRLKPFVAWFEMPQCPMNLSGLKTLRLHRSSMYDHESTATLLNAGGASLSHLDLEGPYRATESDQVHLGYNPNIRTLALINLQQTETYDPVQWILSLFRPLKQSLLHTIRLEVHVEQPSHEFWGRWGPVDDLFSLPIFQALEEVILVVSSSEKPYEPKSIIEEGFPQLVKKGIVKVETEYRERELSRALVMAVPLQ
ncbi:hypothetical protein VNI00_016004 [Paramarasmius palmivorus]|uniref:F-box domain-containing protein n=1 Tax=Paramarasmius palmivorus TaxID=297713 RepID=A0AAW0BGD2_9AGAR